MPGRPKRLNRPEPDFARLREAARRTHDRRIAYYAADAEAIAARRRDYEAAEDEEEALRRRPSDGADA